MSKLSYIPEGIVSERNDKSITFLLGYQESNQKCI